MEHNFSITITGTVKADNIKDALKKLDNNPLVFRYEDNNLTITSENQQVT